METGALLHFEDANYELLAGAMRTIKSILDRALSSQTARDPAMEREVERTEGALTAEFEDGGMPFVGQDSWDFDINFWANLAEHPFLADLSDGAAEF